MTENALITTLGARTTRPAGVRPAAPLSGPDAALVGGASRATGDAPGQVVLNEECVSPAAWREDHDALQARLLAGVSRTFALTIPQLPQPLRRAVGNAYLLCRIADTIEDDPALDAAARSSFQSAFLAALRTGLGAPAVAESLHSRLSRATPAAELELVRSMAIVISQTYGLSEAQRRAITRCVAVMTRGMVGFDASGSLGLPDEEALDRYCYTVAGVVGEMLTDLFCHHSPDIAARRDALELHAIRFGRGLQLTNILKDIWEDLEHGRCWLPRQLFAHHGYDLGLLAPGHPHGGSDGFAAALRGLVGTAHADLRAALRYVLAIPPGHVGIRLFLVWALLLAAATLRNINARPLFSECAEVKVTRRSVTAILAASRLVIRSRVGLTTLFRLVARGLPLPPERRSSEQTSVRPVLTSG